MDDLIPCSPRLITLEFLSGSSSCYLVQEFDFFVADCLHDVCRKRKRNWRTSCKQLKSSSACARRRCRSRWWSAPSRSLFKSRKSCARRRSWTPRSVDRLKQRNSSKFIRVKFAGYLWDGFIGFSVISFLLFSVDWRSWPKPTANELSWRPKPKPKLSVLCLIHS